MATTTSTVHSGLMKVLLPLFEAETGYHVEVLAMGSGAAIELAMRGGADVVLAHAREAEDEFVRKGYGTNRRDVMYNDFVLLGPSQDPAEVQREQRIVAALKRIAQSKARFVSRGDGSGTNIRELALFKLAELQQPGTWLTQTHQGMLPSLRAASERAAYVLSDRATYLFNRRQLELSILLEGDKQLFNPYGVIAVNPNRLPGVDYAGAMAFISFITGTKAQTAIKAYGRQQVGANLFVPMALETPHEEPAQ